MDPRCKVAEKEQKEGVSTERNVSAGEDDIGDEAGLTLSTDAVVKSKLESTARDLKMYSHVM